MYWFLDAGHGGVGFGKYLTKGKQFKGFFEGEFNRKLARAIKKQYKKINGAGNVLILNDTPINIREGKKVAYANKLYRSLGKPKSAYLALHVNAARGNKYSEAHGTTIFCSRGSQKGLKLAERFDENFNILVASDQPRWFKSNRGIKRKNFTVLWRTAMTAVLIENGFMTNLETVKLLKSTIFIKRLAREYAAIMTGHENQTK